MIPPLSGPGGGRRRDAKPGGFSLVELMISMAVLAVILVITLSIVANTQSALRQATASTEQFRSAREAFDTLKRHISDATLNTYWDYEYDSAGLPLQYSRQSELHFVSGPAKDLLSGGSAAGGEAIFFGAPFGYTQAQANGDSAASDAHSDLKSLLNGWGYFIDWRSDDDVPSFVADKPWYQDRKRFRLLEYRQPSESLTIYDDYQNSIVDKKPGQVPKSAAYRWFQSGLASPENTRVVADNIVALIVRPLLPPRQAEGKGRDAWWVAPAYLYDSREYLWGAYGDRQKATRNQLPPLLQVTMVAVDEQSMSRYLDQHGGNMPNLGLDNLFADSSETRYQADLDTLSSRLTDMRLNYRIFTATVGMRTAKWSE